MQQSFDQEPLVSASERGTETHYTSRRTSLEASVRNHVGRALSADWSVACEEQGPCEPEYLRLNLRSQTCPGYRFADADSLRLRLEAEGEVIYEGGVFHSAAEGRSCAVGGVWMNELVTAPLTIAGVSYDGGTAIFSVYPKLPEGGVGPTPVPVRAPIRGWIGDTEFELTDSQLLPLSALADTVRSWAGE